MTAELRLALDTTSDRLSVALQRGGEPAVVRSLEGARRHAAGLHLLADELLATVGARPRDIAVVVMGDGPGSFTGLRVGAAFAKAITASGSVRLVVVPSLLSRAAPHAAVGQTVLALSPAMRGEVFCGGWTFDQDGVVQSTAARAVTAGHLLSVPRPDLVVGEAPAEVERELRSAWGLGLQPSFPDAAELLKLALLRGASIEVTDPEGWEPHYGRPAEAQARWEREHGRPLPDSLGDRR